MRILIISPYHGGSHQSWADGYRKFSNHEVRLLTLPARFWKWRMHGGAVTLARRYRENRRAAQGWQPDLLLATDMLDLTTFVSLTRDSGPRIPIVLYMHENQLTYPLPSDPQSGPMRRQRGERDLHYVFINYASMLAADHVLFNSHYHLESYLQALPAFLKHFPEYNELGSISSLREKSSVLPVGLDLEALAAPRSRPDKQPLHMKDGEAPLILWNQRWEYDKDPSAFFQALYQVTADDLPFRLALCGEQFSNSPVAFEEALDKLSEQIMHVGYAEFEEYRRLLWSADIVISTALHEFFGISILEAIACQTFPILPKRLSYPELIPEPFHASCLYEDKDEFLQRLRWALRNPRQAAAQAERLVPAMARYGWATIAPGYDAFFSDMVAGSRDQVNH